MTKPRLWYLRNSPIVPEGAILVGDVRRLEIFSKMLKKTQVVEESHGMKLVTGQYKKIPVCILAYGMGAPAAAVAIEELSLLGAKIVVRAGTAMAFSCPLGTFVLAKGGVRMEGTSGFYLPLEFPALPDYGLLRVFEETLSDRQSPFLVGLVASIDGLYPNRLKSAEDMIPKLRKCGVVAADMETTAIYIISSVLNLKAISLCLATVSYDGLKSLSDKQRRAFEKVLAEIALEGLYKALIES